LPPSGPASRQDQAAKRFDPAPERRQHAAGQWDRQQPDPQSGHAEAGGFHRPGDDRPGHGNGARDGGAGVVLVNDDWLRDHPWARPLGRIEGWGHRTVGLGLRQKLDRSRDDPAEQYVLPHVRTAVLDAFDRAQVTLDDVDGFEVHDCFTPSEYLAIDHIGLTGPGESWKAIENGEIEIGGRLPINPSGGLIGGGHPVGASGVRMLLDAARQVSDTAGAYQVEGAKTFATLNFGGSTATTVSFVIGRPQ